MKQYFVKVRTKEQLKAVRKWGKAAALLKDLSLLPDLDDSCPVYYCLPEVLREKRMEELEKTLRKLPREAGLVAENPDELGLIQETGFSGSLIAGSFLYAYNSQAMSFYRECFPGIRFIAGDELTGREVIKLAGDNPDEIIFKIYGYEPLMITSQCFGKNETACREKRVKFRKEDGESFFADSDCGNCFSRICYGKPLWLADRKEELPKGPWLLDFTMESGAETRKVLDEIEEKAFDPGKYTRGHFFRGID